VCSIGRVSIHAPARGATSDYPIIKIYFWIIEGAIMPNKLTVKQEKFAVNYFKLGNATEAAIKAGYSPRTAAVIATENLRKPNIAKRLAELQDKVSSDAIMSVQERKERLSEIARARLTDLVSCGPDGSWINVGVDGCQSAAIKGIKSRTEYDKNGDDGAVITDIELHDPMKAIDLLNKMEHLYETETGMTINNDNRVLNINVTSLEAKKVTDAICRGE
jgi:Phage terminase, small subunit